MNKSDSIKELAAALAKAQGEIRGATKDSANPFFKSKYADLASVMDACREPLSKNGLAIIQTTEASDGTMVSLQTMLAHSSGEWITGVVSMKPVKNDPQGIGSCLTYARRYGLMAMVGIAPEDDDGNRASSNPAPSGPPNKADHVNKILDFLESNNIPEQFIIDLCVQKNLCPKGTSEIDEMTGEVLKKLASDEGLERIVSRFNEQSNPEEAPTPVDLPEPAPKETMDEVSWKEIVVTFAPFKGKKLKDLSQDDIFSIYRSFKPGADVESIRMKKALLQWMHEVQSQEGK